MSYERTMLETLAMPAKREVKNAVITTLFKHNGSVREFAIGEPVVVEIADMFALNTAQRSAVLERTYQKENRTVKTPLWHRLLYRAADELVKEALVTRPTDTARLTNKKEWMLTEKGVDYACKLLHIPSTRREALYINSFEIRKEIKKIKETPRPKKYIPFETANKPQTAVKAVNIRSRSFRRIVIETYDYTCCVCGLKMRSPDAAYWEVEAAHIVPRGSNGKDDIWNGIALCRLHHWAFDVGWFAFSHNYRMLVSSRLKDIPHDFGKTNTFDFFSGTLEGNKMMLLPEGKSLHPHEKSLEWHRENIFYP